MMDRTVEDVFSEEKITKEHIEEMAEESEYWEKASRFIVQNWTFAVRHLSEAQANWMGKIVDDLVEMRIENKGIFK